MIVYLFVFACVIGVVAGFIRLVSCLVCLVVWDYCVGLLDAVWFVCGFDV